MGISSKGYDGLGIIDDHEWLPTGRYWFRGGISLPAGRTTRTGFRLVGGICWACLDTDATIFLIRGRAWTQAHEVGQFLSSSDFEGFKNRFFTCESGKDVWASTLKFGNIPDRYRPSPVFVETFTSDYYRDLILRFLETKSLKYQKDGLFYKEIGLFLTDPKHELSPLLESVGYLLNGFELKHRMVFNGKIN